MTANASEEIPSSCIVSALEATNSVDKYNKTHIPGQSQWGCSEGFHKSKSYDYYEYFFDNYEAGIQVFTTSDGKSILTFSSTIFGNTIERNEIKVRKEVMDSIYEEMRKKCKGLPRQEEVTVECIQSFYTRFYSKPCEE